MIPTKRKLTNLPTPAAFALALFLCSLGAATCAAQSIPPVPVIASASVPFYPRVAQLAHIEGSVRLRISTDGKQASSIEIESGPPMLAQAAEDNVKTWRFDRHKPTTFEATFRYKLSPSKCDAKCNCNEADTGEILLRLPTNVEVNAIEVQTCDPAIEKKH